MLEKQIVPARINRSGGNPTLRKQPPKHVRRVRVVVACLGTPDGWVDSHKDGMDTRRNLVAKRQGDGVPGCPRRDPRSAGPYHPVPYQEPPRYSTFGSVLKILAQLGGELRCIQGNPATAIASHVRCEGAGESAGARTKGP